MRTAVLCGGSGGAKLARGFAGVLPPEELTVIVNTADDDVFHGLHVSPDIDSLLYRLAGCFNDELAFGVAGDTFHAMAMLERLGEPAWFRLGDQDLGLQLVRQRLLNTGLTLSEAVAAVAARLGVRCAVAPMSDDPVRTCVLTDGGGLRFQEWFVRDRCAPVVRGLRLDGVGRARPSPMAQRAYETAELVVIAPSNPLLSIDPILRVLAGCRPGGAVVAVSPLIGGRALKGPTVEVLRALGEEPTAAGIAAHYAGLASHLIIDVADADQARGLEDTGLRVHVAQTVMEDDAAAERLAAAVLNAVAGAREA